MEIERRVRRKPIHKKEPGYSRFHWFVGTLYLEDLWDIYSALDDALGPARAHRAEQIERWEDEQRRTAEWWQEVVELSEEFDLPIDSIEEEVLGPKPKSAMPTYLTDPLIHMETETYQFDDIDDVGNMPRQYYPRFQLFTPGPPTIFVSVTGGSAFVSVDVLNDETHGTIARIEGVIKRHQNSIGAFVIRRIYALAATSIIGLMIALLTYVLDGPIWLLSTAFMAGGLPLVLGMIFNPLTWRVRRRGVVPRYRSEAETWWDKRGVEVVIGLLSLVLAAAGVVATVIYS